MSGSSIRARAPTACSPAVRRVMQANVPRNTSPELRLRRALHAAGLRFRKDARPEPTLRCTADVIFRRQRVCVFVDGCFWHRCHHHFVAPRTNAAWWLEKIAANVERDRRQTTFLRSRGWQVVRAWEHELSEPARVVQRVLRALRCHVQVVRCPAPPMRTVHASQHRARLSAQEGARGSRGSRPPVRAR